jgi:hypothetical protein
MPGRNTAPPEFLQSTKQILRPGITLLKDFLNYSDSSYALARTNGRSAAADVLEFSLLLSLLQGKESKEISTIFNFCSFGLNQKNQKFKPKTNTPLFLAGQRTWTSIKDCKYLLPSN